MPQKLMFLYLKTGGGHLSPARSVAKWLEKNNPNDVNISLVDGFENAPKIVKLVVEDGYRKSQDKARWVFEGLYAINKIKPFARLSRWLVSFFVLPVLAKKIRNHNPDKIVIFHFFLIDPVKKALKKMGLHIPVLTVVTDPFTAHPIWFLDADQIFLVFSSVLKNHLVQRHGINPENITEFPFIIEDKYSYELSKKKKELIKLSLGIRLHNKIILIMGGADGIPKGKEIVEELLKADLNAEIVMVCGKNQNLHNKILKLKSKYNAQNLHIFGFVDFVYELLNISDLVITKCGASTFMEVLLCRKIPLINSYLWEQEKGNVDFICDNNLGLYEKDTNKIPDIVSSLLINRSETIFFQKNIEKLKLINGTPQVSKYILNFQN